MLCPDEMNYFAIKLNVIKVNDNRITYVEKVNGTTTDINLKNQHT